VWVRVDRRDGGELKERFVCQLVRAVDGGWQIAVRTPLG
jgi:hypothetical protein